MNPKKLPDRHYVRGRLHYDADTGIFRWRQRPLVHFASSRLRNSWNARFVGKATGSADNRGYLVIIIDYRPYKAHRLAWLMVHGTPLPDEIDHINGNKADNRIANLRAATRSDNRANCSSYRNNSTGIKGVILRKTGRFEAKIKSGGRSFYLGVFSTLDEAAEVRRKAAEQLHGVFARHG